MKRGLVTENFSFLIHIPKYAGYMYRKADAYLASDGNKPFTRGRVRYKNYDDWNEKNGNETYDQTRLALAGITGAVVFGVAIDQCEGCPLILILPVTSPALIMGGVAGWYAHFTFPALALFAVYKKVKSKD